MAEDFMEQIMRQQAEGEQVKTLLKNPDVLNRLQDFRQHTGQLPGSESFFEAMTADGTIVSIKEEDGKYTVSMVDLNLPQEEMNKQIVDIAVPQLAVKYIRDGGTRTYPLDLGDKKEELYVPAPNKIYKMGKMPKLGNNSLYPLDKPTQ